MDKHLTRLTMKVTQFIQVRHTEQGALQYVDALFSFSGLHNHVGMRDDVLIHGRWAPVLRCFDVHLNHWVSKRSRACLCHLAKHLLS